LNGFVSHAGSTSSLWATDGRPIDTFERLTASSAQCPSSNPPHPPPRYASAGGQLRLTTRQGTTSITSSSSPHSSAPAKAPEHLGSGGLSPETAELVSRITRSHCQGSDGPPDAHKQSPRPKGLVDLNQRAAGQRRRGCGPNFVHGTRTSRSKGISTRVGSVCARPRARSGPYSTRRNSAMATPSRRTPIARTSKSSSPIGTVHDPHVTPGLSRWTTAEGRSRRSNTARRIGSTT
jgi:hypothetical protein